MPGSSPARAGLRVAAALIGAVIGAGFASGRELATFFGPLGGRAGLGIGLSAVAMAAGAVAVASVARRCGGAEYGALLTATAGPRLGALLDRLLTGFLFLTASVTLAGGAALLQTTYRWGPPAALLATALLASLVTWRGAAGLLRAGAWLVVPLLLALLAVAGASLASGTGPTAPAPPAPGGPPPGPLAPAAAGLLYAGLNLLLASGLIAAAVRHEPPGAAATGGAAAGAALGLLAWILWRALAAAGPEVTRAELPVAALAARLGPWAGTAYAVAFYLAVLTTVAAAASALAERTAPARWAKAPLLVWLAALPAGLGFAGLVRMIYPPMGLLGAVWLWRLLCLPLPDDDGARPGPHRGRNG